MKNRLIFVWRALKANRLCSVINVIGLGIGLACTLVVVKYVWQEYTTDRFHANYDRIYGCTSKASGLGISRLDEVLDYRRTKSVYPEIETYTSVGLFDDEPLVLGQKKYEARVGFTSPTIFQVFSLKLVAGDTATALRQEDGLVITEHLARRLFGKEDPLGKEIVFWNKVYRVNGILEDLPVNSTLAFDALIQDRGDFGRVKAEFILLKENCCIRQVNERINQEETRIHPRLNYEYIPFAGLYFNPNVNTDLLIPFEKGNIRFLVILMFAALLILFISLVNYLNIYQVALLKREKELGIKRVHGMENGNLWLELWLENLILVLGATCLSVGLMMILARVIHAELGVPLGLNLRFDLALLLGIGLILPVVTTVWPYLKFRREQPAMAVKTGSTSRSNTTVRRVLLGVQYVMTLVMLIVSGYFIKQLHFMLNKDLGVNQENILSVELFKQLRVERTWDDDPNVREARMQKIEAIVNRYDQDIQYIRNEIDKYPFVQHACPTHSPLEYQMNDWRIADREGEFMNCPTLDVVPEFKELYGLKLKEGRFFEAGKEVTRGPTVVINETAKKYFGIQNIEKESLKNKYWDTFTQAFQIIGVVEDFRFTPLTMPLQPLVMIYFGDTQGVPYQMQVTFGKEKETIDFLSRLYNRLEPNQELKYHFFQEEIDRLYEKDKKTARIATIFTILAVFISAFGLFGFAYFDARQRYREIGIRKVNGATTSQVLWLLINRFLLLIGIAFGVAVPLAWGLIRRYQENFVETTPASWWLFAVALLGTVLIVFVTLYRQSYKAATTNPVEALKNE